MPRSAAHSASLWDRPQKRFGHRPQKKPLTENRPHLTYLARKLPPRLIAPATEKNRPVMTPFQLRLSKARFWDAQSPLLPPDHRFLFSTQSRASEPAIELPLLLKSQAFPRLLFSVDCPSRLSFQFRVRPRIELPLFSFVSNSSAVLLRVSWFRYFLFSLDLTLPRARQWASPIGLRRVLRRALLWLPS